MKRLLEGKVSSDPLVMKLIEENKALEIKLDEVTKSRDHLAELCAQSNYIRIIQGLESRLHQLSEDHSHCEDLLNELGARASSAESRLDAVQAQLDAVMLEYCAGDMTPEQIENWAKSQHSCRREAAPTPAPLLDGLSPQGQPANGSPETVIADPSTTTGEPPFRTNVVERQAPFEEDWHTEIK
jgi:uncharacterized coiled-coil protein SlyX